MKVRTLSSLCLVYLLNMEKLSFLCPHLPITVCKSSYLEVREQCPHFPQNLERGSSSLLRRGCSVSTDSVKDPIFPDFVDSFPDFTPISLPYFPILCKLNNLTL